MPESISQPLSTAEAYEQIAVVFDASHIEYLQYDLWRWFRSVLENKVYQYRRSPVNLLYLRRHIGSFLTAADCLLQHGLQEHAIIAPLLLNTPDKLERQQIKDLSFLYETYGGRVLRLSRAETEEPLQFIYRLFAFQPVEDWQELLEEWLEYGLDKTGMSDFGDTEDLPEALEWLLGLCEACWLLHCRQKQQLAKGGTTGAGVVSNLQPVKDLVIRALAPEAIFQINQPDTKAGNEDTYTDWLIVIPNEQQKKPFQEMETLLDMLAGKHQQLCWSLHQSAHLKQQLMEGELYYRLVCQPIYQVYGQPYLLPETAEDLATALTTASQRFDQTFARSLKFSASAQQCRKGGQAEAAMFLFHQAAELCLRGLMLALTGKDRKTHELRVLLRYCRRLAPGLSGLFPAENDGALHVLSLLEKAYLDARYADNYSVDAFSLQQVEKKVNELQEAVCRSWEEWQGRAQEATLSH